MPRVNLNKMKYKKKDLSDWVRGQLRCKGLTQQDVCESLDCSQQAISYKLKNCSFSYEELVKVLNMLEADDQTILKFMKMR